MAWLGIIRLAGKVALITGAKVILNGAKVIIADIDPQLGQSTASGLAAPTPHSSPAMSPKNPISHLLLTLPCPSMAASTSSTTMQALPALSCAPSITSLHLHDFDRTMSVNVRSVVTGIKHAAWVMIPQCSGCILCTASVTGIMGGMAPHDYSISKAAVIRAVRSATTELSKYGIRVNCISPFAVATPMGVNAMKKLVFGGGMKEEEMVEMINGMGQLEGAKCEAEDVVRAAVYLASEEAKYVSGHNLVVDGGFTAFKVLNLV